MSPVVRPLGAEDIEFIVRLEYENFTIPWSRESFVRILNDKNYRCFVALDGEQLIGYVVALIVVEEADVMNVCTARSHRGQGIATLLLKELFTVSEEQGVGTYFLEVRESNVAAQSLYRKLGFEEIGIRRFYYDEPREHAIVMRKITTTLSR